MGRAMDKLDVFTFEGAHGGQQEEPLQDLVRVFRLCRRHELGSSPGSRSSATGALAARVSFVPALVD